MKKQRITFEQYHETVKGLKVPLHANRIRRFYDMGYTPLAVFDIWCAEKRSNTYPAPGSTG